MNYIYNMRNTHQLSWSVFKGPESKCREGNARGNTEKNLAEEQGENTE